jgi:hypothetical protein
MLQCTPSTTLIYFLKEQVHTLAKTQIQVIRLTQVE